MFTERRTDRHTDIARFSTREGLAQAHPNYNYTHTYIIHVSHIHVSSIMRYFFMFSSLLELLYFLLLKANIVVVTFHFVL